MLIRFDRICIYGAQILRRNTFHIVIEMVRKTHSNNAPDSLITPPQESDRSHLVTSAATLNSSSLKARRTAHSQTTSTRQPSSFCAARSRISRARFADIFCSQNALFEPGFLKYRQPCPCQKHPCTTTRAWYLGKTMSGLPGISLACSRYRKPCACSHLRTNISGFVFFPLIPDIIRLRVALSTTSTIAATLPGKSGRRVAERQFGLRAVGTQCRLHQPGDVPHDVHHH